MVKSGVGADSEKKLIHLKNDDAGIPQGEL